MHVLDASRAVGVVASLLDPKQRAALRREEPRASRTRLRELHAQQARASRCCRSPRRARNRPQLDWRREDIAAPAFLGAPRARRRAARRARPLHRLDLLLHGLGAARASSRRSSSTPRRRGGARAVRQRASSCSTRIIDEKLLTRARRLRLLARRSDGDDIVLYADEARAQRARALPHAAPAAGARPTTSRTCSLADFVAPLGARPRRLRRRVRRDRGHRRRRAGARASRRELDDYSAIIVKALADRLAEAFAECLHAARAPRVGLRRRRDAHERRADRREVPRHPPRLRLPGLPRPHREGDAVRAARRAARVGIDAHRELRDDARPRA